MNLKEYLPTNKKYGEHTLYLQDDKNRDWYASQHLFTKKFIVEVYSATQIVKAISNDVSLHFPAECDVLEFDEIPADCNIDGSWIFDGEKLVKRTVSAAEIIAFAVEKKATLKAAADSEIDWLQDAVDAEKANEKEISALAAWRKYRIALMRIDISHMPIIWPTTPEE
ncbi:hypothetical protein B7R74_07415 [Yersinia pseudotuberculosis]|nr:hypothetical protein B7R74_07415 [Yersinia pseudotuberculosis]